MIKKFTESIIILATINLLVKPIWVFGIERTIQNRVGADEYGLYFSLFSFSLLFNIFSDLGITNYNNRSIARNNHLISQQFGHIFPLKTGLVTVYSFITLTAALFIGYTLNQIYLLFILSLNQALNSFILYLRSNITGLQLFKTDSIISVTDKLLLIIICSYLLWGSSATFKIEWLIYSQTFSYGFTFLVALIILQTKTKKVKFRLNLIKIKSTLRRSFPYAILIFLMMIYTRIDAVMLERMLPDGKTQAGIYAQAFRILDALSMFAFLFASILLPLFAKMIKQKQEIISILKQSFAMLLIPAIGLMSGLLYNSKQLMQLMYVKHTFISAEILIILMFGFIGICTTYIFGTLLTAAGKLNNLNKIALTSVFINIASNFLLIPLIGAKGAAISSAVTQIIMGLLQAIIAIKYLKIKIRYSIYIKYLAIILSSVLFSWLLKKALEIWYLHFLITIISTISLAFVLKLLKVEDFKNLFSKK